MSRSKQVRVLILALTLAAAGLAEGNTMPLSFVGRMTEADGRPVVGPVKVEVRFFRSPSGDDEVNVDPLVLDNVVLDDGVFNLPLALPDAKFHVVFPDTSTAAFIQVNDVTHKRVYPRQALSPVPYALKVPVDGKTIGYDSDGLLTVGPTSTPAAGEFLTKNSSGNFIWQAPLNPSHFNSQTVGTEAAFVATLGSADAGRIWYNQSSGQIKYWTGSVPVTLGVAGSGLTSLNGQLGNAQSFAIGTSGLAPAWSSAANNHTLNLPLASAAGVTGGLVSKAAYDSFAAKAAAGANGDITSLTGLTNDAISGDKIDGGVISNFSSTGIDDNATGTAVTIDAAGKVGLGTTAPSNKLTVAFNEAGTSTSNAPLIYVQHTSTGTTGYPYAGITIDHSNGGVSTRGGSYLGLANSGTGGSAVIQFDYFGGGLSGTDENLKIENLTATGNLLLNTNATERVRITGAGNVGIGTSTPATQLDVVGSVQLSSDLLFNNDLSTNHIFIKPSRAAVGPYYGVVWQSNVDAFDGANGGASIEMYPNFGVGSNDGGRVNIIAYGEGTGSRANAIRLFTRSSPANVTERMRVNSDGNVGIGSTAPGYTLDVNGTVRATNFISTSGTSNWGASTLTNVAGVSIGTTATGSDLLFGAGANRAITIQSQATAGNGLTIQAGGTTGSNLSGGDLTLASGTANGTGSSRIDFKTASGGAPATSMTILGNGNVGIRTTTPIEALEVANGSIAATNSTKNIGIKLLADSQGSDANNIQFGQPNVYDGKADLRFTSWFGASTYMTIRGSDGTGHVSMGAGGLRTLPENQLEVYASSVPLGPKIADFSGIKVMNTATSTTASLIKSGINIISDGAWSGTGATNVGLMVSSVTGGARNYDAIFNGGGNVGIGTTDPSQMLTVAGVVKASKVNAGLSDAMAFGGGDFSLAAKNGLQVLQGVSTDEIRIRMSNSDNSLQLAFWNYDPVSDSVFFGSKTASPLRFGVGVERMRIDSAGNVGIGTTSPGELLDIQKSTTGVSTEIGAARFATISSGDIVDGFTSSIYLGMKDAAGSLIYGGVISAVRDGADDQQALELKGRNGATANNGQLWLDSSGKVGIGTTNPTFQLDIGAGAYLDGRMNLNGTQPLIQIQDRDTTLLAYTKDWTVQAYQGRFRLLEANTTEVLSVISGKVGIGTTSPQATLDINGFMRLAKNAGAPATCDASHDASLAMTSAYKICICKSGTGWTDQLTQAACIW